MSLNLSDLSREKAKVLLHCLTDHSDWVVFDGVQLYRDDMCDITSEVWKENLNLQGLVMWQVAGGVSSTAKESRLMIMIPALVFVSMFLPLLETIVFQWSLPESTRHFALELDLIISAHDETFHHIGPFITYTNAFW